MADCQHKNLSRLFIAGAELPAENFLYGCTKCKETLVAALEGTIQAAKLRHAERETAEPIPEISALPDHAAVVQAAEMRFSSAGLNFETWANMLREGSVSEAIFTRQAVSLGFQLGDVEQLIAAVFSSSEKSATE